MVNMGPDNSKDSRSLRNNVIMYFSNIEQNLVSLNIEKSTEDDSYAVCGREHILHVCEIGLFPHNYSEERRK